jgi:hypothetical protein
MYRCQETRACDLTAPRERDYLVAVGVRDTHPARPSWEDAGPVEGRIPAGHRPTSGGLAAARLPVAAIAVRRDVLGLRLSPLLRCRVPLLELFEHIDDITGIVIIIVNVKVNIALVDGPIDVPQRRSLTDRGTSRERCGAARPGRAKVCDLSDASREPSQAPR